MIVVTPPSSGIEVSESNSITVGTASSSVITMDAPVTEIPGTAVAPPTDTASSGSSISSCVGASVKVPVYDRALAGIMIVNPVTSAKSVPSVAVPDPTVTATGVASPRAPPFSLAVTVIVAAPALSPADSGDTVRATPLDAVSSSSTVTSTEATVTPP